MTDELSVIELILGASLTVKFVMATLVAASVTSWFMIVQRVIILGRANEELLDFEDRFWSGMDLAQLYREGSDAIEEGVDITGGEALFRAGFKEFSKLSRQPNMDAKAMVEGSRRAMRVALMRESDRLERHLPFLASVGSTSPYIGLFGTVWGDHALVSWIGYQLAGYARGCGSRYFGGINSDCHGAICSHSSGPGLQPICGKGGCATQSL